MKRMSNKGFTLIELLAVITIMGILMLVAIPAVTRTIENSRRDTFADVAGEYLTAVRNGVLADEIECFYTASGADWTVASALPDGTYYFPICTNDGDTTCIDIALGTGEGASSYSKASIKTSTTDLLETGGKSPFGNADVYGYVTWTKKTESDKSKTEYKVFLQDTGKHGLSEAQTSKNLKRSVVNPDLGTNASTAKIQLADATAVCRMA